jgi:hypothetical protein
MPEPTPIEAAQTERLVDLMRATRTSLSDLLDPLGVTMIAELNQRQHISAMSLLQQRRFEQRSVAQDDPV